MAQFSVLPASTPLPLFTLRLYSSGGGLIQRYVFPISPAQLRKNVAAMTQIYDVQNINRNRKIQRYVDLYGYAPPIWNIEGTQGQAYHSTDGFQYTGLESYLAMQQLFDQYFQALQIGQNAPTLEFYDHYSGDFWEVVPWQVQIFGFSIDRPKFPTYRLVLAGVNDLSGQISTAAPDSIASTFSQTPDQVGSGQQGVIDNIMQEYVL